LLWVCHCVWSEECSTRDDSEEVSED